MPPTPPTEELDVLVIGAGFAGIYQLDRLRDLGYSVKIYEAGSELGGIWYWNCYPGARVDTEGPLYQFAYKDLWKDWEYSSLYPDWSELREYFDLRRPQARPVEGHPVQHPRHRGRLRHRPQPVGRPHRRRLAPRAAATWCPASGSPPSPTSRRSRAWTRSEGDCHHTALLAAGGTGLHRQAGRRDRHRRQRRPGHPGGRPGGGRPDRVPADAEPRAADGTAARSRPTTRTRSRRSCRTGSRRAAPRSPGSTSTSSRRTRSTCPTRSATPATRISGARAGSVSGSPSTRTRCSSRSPTTTPTRSGGTRSAPGSTTRQLAEKLAPTGQLHPFGVKRPSLEQTYYDVYNQDNVHLVDLGENPIDTITETGIRTRDGVEHEFDIIVLATGFDSVSGGLTRLDIRGTDGSLLREQWANGVRRAPRDRDRGLPEPAVHLRPAEPVRVLQRPDLRRDPGRDDRRDAAPPALRRRQAGSRRRPRPTSSGASTSPGWSNRRSSRRPSPGTWERTSPASRCRA